MSGIDKKGLEAGILAVKDALIKGMKQQVILYEVLEEAFIEAYDAAMGELPRTPKPMSELVEKLDKLATHIEGMDSGSGDAKTIREAIAELAKATPAGLVDIKADVEEALRPLIRGIEFQMAVGVVLQTIRPYLATPPDAVRGWQPIETAPKDGTHIIVGYDFATVWIIHNAWWREVNDDLISMGWDKEDTGWWSYIEHSVTQHKLEGNHMPTHWMPLPKQALAKNNHKGE